MNRYTDHNQIALSPDLAPQSIEPIMNVEDWPDCHGSFDRSWQHPCGKPLDPEQAANPAQLTQTLLPKQSRGPFA